MKNTIVFSLLVLLCFFVSCAHKNPGANAPANYLTVGFDGGAIFLPHNNYYKVTSGQLLEDSTVPFLSPPVDLSSLNFNIVLPAARYDTVKALLSSIPAELFSQNNMHIGTMIPDVGYADVSTVVNGTAYRWYFEANQSASSQAVQQFVNTLQVDFR